VDLNTASTSTKALTNTEAKGALAAFALTRLVDMGRFFPTSLPVLFSPAFAGAAGAEDE